MPVDSPVVTSYPKRSELKSPSIKIVLAITSVILLLTGFGLYFLSASLQSKNEGILINVTPTPVKSVQFSPTINPSIKPSSVPTTVDYPSDVYDGLKDLYPWITKPTLSAFRWNVDGNGKDFNGFIIKTNVIDYRLYDQSISKTKIDDFFLSHGWVLDSGQEACCPGRNSGYTKDGRKAVISIILPPDGNPSGKEFIYRVFFQ